ncbi:hypothetical protein CEXT_677091 [Caerostris extrusa]|uniref:Uncharacterized protein n=1 Tax=Caerostris extrusa TaxID=172846 RepID=A0AAV4NN24_CAEEX|nr:hypothetical protein CEXT_677091 [Caerostris extrusa]
MIKGEKMRSCAKWRRGIGYIYRIAWAAQPPRSASKQRLLDRILILMIGFCKRTPERWYQEYFGLEERSEQGWFEGESNL